MARFSIPDAVEVLWLLPDKVWYGSRSGCELAIETLERGENPV